MRFHTLLHTLIVLGVTACGGVEPSDVDIDQTERAGCPPNRECIPPPRQNLVPEILNSDYCESRWLNIRIRNDGARAAVTIDTTVFFDAAWGSGSRDFGSPNLPAGGYHDTWLEMLWIGPNMNITVFTDSQGRNGEASESDNWLYAYCP